MVRFPGTGGLVKVVSQGTNLLLEGRVYGDDGWLATPKSSPIFPLRNLCDEP